MAALTPENFVRTWQESSTVQEVADKLSLSKANVSHRASRYRKKGVPLKAMGGRGHVGAPIDWKKLAEIALETE